MNAARRRSFWVIVGAVICILLVGAVIVSAQSTPPPITIGQNMAGNITDPATPVQFSLSVAAPQSINIQVLAITPAGFAPAYRVLDASSAVILDMANPGTLASVQGSVDLSPGTYTLEVRSANPMAGTFLIATQAGAPLAPPTPLIPGQPVTASVNPQTPRQAYAFSGVQTDVLLLDISSTSPTSGPVITLRNADTDQTLSVTTAMMAGVSYHVPMGTTNYLLEVTSSGAAEAESATICLSSESGSVTCPNPTPGGQLITLTPTPVVIVPTAAPPTPVLIVPTSVLPPTLAPVVIDPNGPCEVTPTGGTSDNIRSGPGMEFPVIVQLPFNATALVIGRTPDNSWLQVNDNGILGWISTTVVVFGGSCGGVPVVEQPTEIAPTSVPPTTMPTNPPASTSTPGSQVTFVPPFQHTPTPTTHFQEQAIGTLQLQLRPTATPTGHLSVQTIGSEQIQIHPSTPIFNPNIVTPCPSKLPSRLSVGENAFTINAIVHFYNLPSPNATVIDTQGYGVNVVVTDGPTCVENTIWWYVKYHGSKYGWVMESTNTYYYLQPG